MRAADPRGHCGGADLAKKLLRRYWGQYTALGDTFLENLQGLTTLKIYAADEHQNQVMNQEAERFRRITMKVLTMQLNSITIMDLVAYGGAALGIVMAVTQMQAGRVGLAGGLAIVLLSADFFLPMRQLGSFFPHRHERNGGQRKDFSPFGPARAAVPPGPCAGGRRRFTWKT